MSTDIKVVVPFHSLSRLQVLFRCVSTRDLHHLAHPVLGDGLTSDPDDECLSDWLSVLSVPYNTGRLRAMTHTKQRVGYLARV